MVLAGISAVIITKNEERNIERCILSLRSVVDEIIVIDSGSVDKTEVICRKYNVRFETIQWKGYSDTKNHGNQLANYSYVLSIDADEALSLDLQKSLLQLKTKGFKYDAYSFAILTNYCGKWIRHCGWYPARKLRLWNNSKGKWIGLIHEAIVLDKDSTSFDLKGDLLHYSYYTIEDHYKQIDHYTELMALNNIEKGKKVNLFRSYISPLVKFFQSYVMRFGFLDGYYGLVVCKLSAYATYRKYRRTKELEIAQKKP